MKFLGVLLLVAFAGLQLSLAQDDVTSCTDISTDLETDAIDPATVPDLPVCVDQRGAPQCCSFRYILARLNITEDDFLEGLRAELRERFADFETIVMRIREFLEGDFLTNYFASLGDFSFLSDAGDLVNGFISDLRDHIDFNPRDDDGEEESTGEDTDEDGFNVGRFLRGVVSRFEDAAVEQFARQSAELGQCIRRVVESHVQEQRMEAQAAALQQIRRVLASIERLRGFLRNFTDDLAGFRPLQQCVDRIVELNTCGRCVARRPPFCRNVCWAIARACYSPFNDALDDQMEVLWEVVRRIIDAATDALGDLNINKGILDVDRSELTQQIATDCQFSFPRSRRQSDNEGGDEQSRSIPLLPAVIRTAAIALRGGPFDYNGRRERGGPGICRRLRLSRASCWDGRSNRPTDIEEFDGDDIDDQVNNPVIDLDEEELREQAASLGTPVSAALNDPSFAQVAPVGLVLPGDEQGNGATTVLISFTSFTLLLIATIFAGL